MAIQTPNKLSRSEGRESPWTTIFFANGLSVDVGEPPTVVDDALMSAAAEFRSAGLTAQDDGAEIRVVPSAVAYLRESSPRLDRQRRREGRKQEGYPVH